MKEESEGGHEIERGINEICSFEEGDRDVGGHEYCSVIHTLPLAPPQPREYERLQTRGLPILNRVVSSELNIGLPRPRRFFSQETRCSPLSSSLLVVSYVNLLQKFLAYLSQYSRRRSSRGPGFIASPMGSTYG